MLFCQYKTTLFYTDKIVIEPNNEVIQYQLFSLKPEAYMIYVTTHSTIFLKCLFLLILIYTVYSLKIKNIPISLSVFFYIT